MNSQLEITSESFTLMTRWAIVLALSVLLISMATGQYGISNYRELVKNRGELSELNMQLSIENQMLEEKMIRLKTSRAAQVRYLKDVHGFVEPTEIVYRFDGKAKKTQVVKNR